MEFVKSSKEVVKLSTVKSRFFPLFDLYAGLGSSVINKHMDPCTNQMSSEQKKWILEAGVPNGEATDIANGLPVLKSQSLS